MLAVLDAARAADAPAPAAAQGQYDRTWRWGTMPVPKLKQAPTIDGTIDPAEWSRATLLPPLVSIDPLPGEGLPPRTRQWVYIGYTDDALYVAWRQDLPETELPVEPKITDQRDRCEGPDNTINIWFDTKGSFPNNFNVAGNAASQIYDRRHDNGQGAHWDGNVTYKSRIIEGGWEGELKFPFSEMGLKAAPEVGTQWPGYFFSAWRKGGTRLFTWPYTIWRPKEAGYFVFVGDAPGVRFETSLDSKLTESAGAELKSRLYRRTQRSPQSFNGNLANAVDASTGEAATWENFDKLVKDALSGFEPATEAKNPGEYLVRWDYSIGGKTIASGTQAGYIAAPLELYPKPYLLVAKKLEVRAEAESKDARTVEVTLTPGGQKQTATLKSQQAVVTFAADNMKEGDYVLAAEAKDADQKVVGKATEPVKRPPPPAWWTNKFGLEPKVPPPWTPVKADAKKVEILGRQYDFENVAVPSQVTTRGKQLLAGPMAFYTSQPWESSKLEVVSQDEEAVTYKSESKAGNLTLRVTSKVDFDGFTFVDLDILGEGNVDKLDFVIPYKKEHAILYQNYMKAPGPGDFNKGGGGDDPNQTNPYRKGKRYVGLVPEKTLQTPPTITAWVGTDHYGMEWSCDSSRGWAMGKPNQAIELIPEGDQVKFVTHLISKSVPLSKDKPRHIRFGLIATPSKTMLPHMAKARLYDDVSVWLMPNDWAGWPCWHAPMTDEKRIADWRDNKIKPAHERGQKVLLNGGWNITADHSDWEYWGKEMVAEPLANVSWSNVKQFAACYNSPYKDFLANSFGANAKLLGFDGIRFDTVVPSYECKSLVHDCGWYDDDGNLWGTESNFPARDAWKRIYRVFHGEEIKEGVVYVPLAAGPIMAVHSFADVHEIGEGFYMHAKNLKEAYPPDMVRAIKNGEPYGLRSQSNLKGSPLWVNERITALLAGNGDPRFGDYRGWKPDYTAQGNPGSNIMEAWEWVDRWNAQFLGYWENSQYLSVDNKAQKMIFASFHVNRDKQRILLAVSNYEPEPIDDLKLQFNFSALGCLSTGPTYAEDAITSEPIALAADGSMKLDLYGQRYRLIRIGRDRPQFDPEELGPNILTGAPPELTDKWQAAVPLEPNSVYLLTAAMKMDKAMGSGTETPNANGGISNFLCPFIGGEDVECQAAKLPSVKLVNDNYATGPVPYRRSPHYANQSMQQYWEQTPGWITIHIPYGTGPAPKGNVLEIRKTGAGDFVLKDLQVRKVK